MSEDGEGTSRGSGKTPRPSLDVEQSGGSLNFGRRQPGCSWPTASIQRFYRAVVGDSLRLSALTKLHLILLPSTMLAVPADTRSIRGKLFVMGTLCPPWLVCLDSQCREKKPLRDTRYASTEALHHSPGRIIDRHGLLRDGPIRRTRIYAFDGPSYSGPA